MRIARGLLLFAALLLLTLPEFSRYRAEHALRGGSGALRVVLAKPEQVSDPAAALNRIAEVAETAASGLAGDPRPRILSGSARLVSGDPSRALEEYRAAFRMGERAETDLNLARAYETLGQVENARAAYLRAAWISPPLLSLLLPDVAAPLVAEVTRLENELKAGRLKEPPPMP